MPPPDVGRFGVYVFELGRPYGLASGLNRGRGVLRVRRCADEPAADGTLRDCDLTCTCRGGFCPEGLSVVGVRLELNDLGGSMEYYFDTHGKFIAFRQAPDARFLFDNSGRWIGWFPWGDPDAVDKQAKYLGTVVGNRLVARLSQPYRRYPAYPGCPGYAGYPGHPGHDGYSGYLAGFNDVDADRLKG